MYRVVASNTWSLLTDEFVASDRDTLPLTAASSFHPSTDCGVLSVETSYPVMLKVAASSGLFVSDSNLLAGMPYGAATLRSPDVTEPEFGS